MAYTIVLLVGLAAGALSGIIGTGSSIILLPILVYQFGPNQAVPIMAVSSLMANIGKMLAWWREVDWRAFAAYAIPGVPAAALGARTLVVLPPRVVEAALGLFFLAMIPPGDGCAPTASVSIFGSWRLRVPRSATSPASSSPPVRSACQRSRPMAC